MLVPGDRVLVGVSGGPDSMALLHLLSRMAPELEISLGVAHLNHCLRGASADGDAKVVQQAASALACPCHMRRARVIKVKRQLGLSLEDAARRVRYAFFRKVMADEGFNKLALGHHMDDNAEQTLMALLRGTGPRGLAGIAPVRDNRIIRPLIDTSRAQIEAYVETEGIACVADESNDDPRFVRNRIRHRLLPLLASSYNPQIKVHLNRLAGVIRTEETWIDVLVAEQYEKALLDRDPGSITLCVDHIRQSHLALARRLVRMALQHLTGSLQRIGFSHIQAVIDLLAGGDEKECHLPGGIRARRSGDRLMLFTATDGRASIAEAPIKQDATVYAVIDHPIPTAVEIEAMGFGLRFSVCGNLQLPPWADVDSNRAYLDLDRLALPLTLRTAVPGDRFTPLGAPGSQKIKKYFIDHRIARADRIRVPVLADARGIVWLVGRRIDDQAKVTSQTSQILRVEFFLLDIR